MQNDDWKERKIGDCIELNYGKGLPERQRKKGNIPVFGSNGIVGFHEEAFVKCPGIIIGRKGSVGEITFSKQDFWPIDTTYYVQTRQGNDIGFWYYLLKTLGLNQMNTHSAVPGLNRDNVYEIVRAIPNLNEQLAIASILSSLDDKIALNRSMNTTLEAIGEALFKHWFIDFEFPNEEGKPYRSSGGEMVETELGEVPKEWEVKPFYEIIDINPNRKLVKDKHAKKVGMADLNTWQSWVESWQLEEYKSGPRFQNGDTLFARITPSLEHGKTAFVSFLDKDEVTFGSTEFIIFAPKVIQSNLYIFHLARSEYVRKAAIGAMTGSSGRQRVPEDLFNQLLICLPSQKIIEKFHKVVAPLFEEITINANQIRNLCKIRDYILPKLISGEIRVK